jgi:Fungalysin metallopeptidase (M36)
MSRERDVRDFRVNRATPERVNALRAAAERISAARPEHRIRITEFDPATGNPGRVESDGATGGGQDFIRRALDHVQAIAPVLGLAERAVELVADPLVPRTSSDARVVHFQQRHHGIPIFQASIGVRFEPDGRLAEAGGSVVTVAEDPPAGPGLSAQEAVLRAARHVAPPEPDEEFGDRPALDLTGFEPRVRAVFAELPERATVLESGPFQTDIKARLTWFSLGAEAVLGWSVVLTMPEYAGQYHTIVDAGSGEILYCQQLARSVAAKGNVFLVDGGGVRTLVDFPRQINDLGLPFPAVTQQGWRWCHKCQSLFFDAAGSKCPATAGAAHDGSQSGFYFLAQNSPAYPGESNWRWCSKCQGLFFGGLAGKCPADGAAHDSSGSGNYVVPNTPIPPGQPGWRRCTACQALFFGDNPGSKCPTGAPGGHVASVQRYSVLDRQEILPAGFPDTWVAINATQGNCADAKFQSQVVVGATQAGVVTFNPASASGSDQRVLNAFYFTCLMHDLFYLLGFRELDGNCQQSNLGRGGFEADRVQISVVNGLVASDANIVVTAEGEIPGPMMSLGYIVQPNNTVRHTALDATVLFHEYMHVVTNRLVGGPANVNALEKPQSGGLGEGWSDYLACTLNNTTVLAAWATGKPGGKRGFPYDSNFPDNFGQLGIGRYANGAEAGSSGPPLHNVGEIWAATLMELSRKTDKYLALQLVVNALKLMLTPNPNFLNARDYLLIALNDMLSQNTINSRQFAGAWQGMWLAFCKFGMGPKATSNGTELAGTVADLVLGEDNWRRCGKCQALFYNGGPQSKCPAPFGSAHDGSSSANYDIVVNWPQAPGEAGWARCAKCQGLFFTIGVQNCPADKAAHNAFGSGDHKLVADPLGSPAEPGWRRCTKCQILFFSAGPNPTCPAGLQHTPAATQNYSLLQH